MKTYIIKKAIVLVFCLGLWFSSNAQKILIGGPSTVSITGDANVYLNDIKTYTASASGVTIFAGNWSVVGGSILTQNTNSATIQWTSVGGKVLEYDATSSTSGFMEGAKLVMVHSFAGPNTPSAPTIAGQNCTSASLQRGTPPSGITWYWQGTNSSGTSTSNSNGTYSITSSGTYYLRARNTSGVWSTGSSSVSVTLGTVGGTTWYEDSDGDLLGDPTSKLVQCTAPSGYVDNGNDQCPNQHGQGASDGCPSGASAFGNENYVYTIIPQVPTTSIASLTEDTDKIESITYFDGLGRPKQQIGIKQSPNTNDIVTHIEYDDFGRQAKEYLPYAATSGNGYLKTDALTATNAYYTTMYAADIDATVPNPYLEKEFEASPLNRVLKQAAPGHDWRLGGGHEIAFEYQTNIAGEVKLYQATTSFANNTYTPTLVGGSDDYASGELYKTITKDENHSGSTKNHTTEEFKNKQGQVVLKRTYNNNIAHDTYYVYDDYGNLTYVLPPEANDHSMDTTVLDAWCYQYTYDYRNRLVAKKIPGKGWEYIVYDTLDRPVLTQDANQRAAATKEWLFTKYDALGRVVYTGIYKDNRDRIALQEDEFNTKTATENYETKQTSAGSLDIYYSNDDFPTSNLEVLTVHYYDSYTFDRAGTGTSITNVYGVSATSRLQGLATGSKVKVLETNHWITTIRYYDEKARPMYVYSKNEYLGTTEIIESQLDDFNGRVLETKTSHTNANDNISGTITTIDNFEYDAAGRLERQTQSGTGRTGTEVILENTYDELGQLATKKVGGKTSQSRLQEIDYAYNVRGWLKNINQDAKSDNDLFNFSLQYNDIAEHSKKLYNGNISGTSWSTASIYTTNTAVSNQYTYAYDALNRITGAEGTDTSNYDVSGISYDKNGNILSLKRHGHTNTAATSFGVMDDLTYSYDSGNQLTKVSDTAPIDQFGFKDDAVNTAADTTNDYTYDDNGNMKTDTNKDITGISYNHLNLPTKVTINNGNIWSGGGQISYVYDATGVKLSKTVSGAYSTVATKYAGNYVYEDRTTIIYGGSTFTSELQFFNHPEGYIQNKNGIFSYVYQYKDHLGNVRLSYADANDDGEITVSSNPNTNEIIEESNYYPFGLEHKGYNNVVSSNGNSTAQKFKFNGVELEESLGLNLYEMPLRFYDPVIARWNRPDPITHFELSPYNGIDNNPIKGSDPTGADVVEIKGGYKFTGEDAKLAFLALTSGPGDKDKKKKKKKRNSTPPKIPTKGSKYSLMGAGYAYGYGINLYQREALLQGRTSLTEEEMDQIDINQGGAVFDLFFTFGGSAKGLSWLYRALFAGSKFSKLKYAGKYGFDSYNKLKKLTAGKGVQVHHLLEQRFAKMLGLKPGQMKSIVLSPSEHQAFTNAWRKAIPYSNSRSAVNTATATKEQIMQAAQQIYKSYPEILKQLK